jgi:hypothetical protein
LRKVYEEAHPRARGDQPEGMVDIPRGTGEDET